MAQQEWPLADRSLARRLERAEAAAGAHFVEARAAVSPASGARWVEIAGAYALFDTADSPVTQSFGLGLFDAIGAHELDRLEGFFRERGAPACHEVSPLADPGLLPLLTSRGYQPIEFTSVMYRPIAGLAGTTMDAGPVRVRLMPTTSSSSLSGSAPRAGGASSLSWRASCWTWDTSTRRARARPRSLQSSTAGR